MTKELVKFDVGNSSCGDAYWAEEVDEVLKDKDAEIERLLCAVHDCPKCGHGHACHLVSASAGEPGVDARLPGQTRGEARWALLTQILDEFAETMEFPGGLHEAFQLGGDAMAQWLDARLAQSDVK